MIYTIISSLADKVVLPKQNMLIMYPQWSMDIQGIIIKRIYQRFSIQLLTDLYATVKSATKVKSRSTTKPNYLGRVLIHIRCLGYFILLQV